MREFSPLQLALGTVALTSLLALSGCAPDNEIEEPHEDAVEGEEALAGFNRHRLLSDVVFTDVEAMTAAEIQTFLEKTPYGTRSVLADYTQDGVRASEAMAAAAKANNLNPMLFLVRAQMEQSLVAKTSASTSKLNAAFGCGCPDGGGCISKYKGFNRQVECMGELMRGYLDDLEAGGTTIAGWKVGKAKSSLDPLTVTPETYATAALYTYTPWVGTGGFGNSLHWVIWKKFAAHTGYQPTAPGNCPAVTYPSGISIQTFPNADAASNYADHASTLGLSTTVPSCFLDIGSLEDFATGTVHSLSSKVASNFTLGELVGNASGQTALVSPVFVDRLQAVRSRVGTWVAVDLGYLSPDDHLASCELASCPDTAAQAYGEGAVLRSGAGASSLLSAVASEGFSNCWQSGEFVYADVGPAGVGCPAN